MKGECAALPFYEAGHYRILGIVPTPVQVEASKPISLARNALISGFIIIFRSQHKGRSGTNVGLHSRANDVYGATCWIHQKEKEIFAVISEKYEDEMVQRSRSHTLTLADLSRLGHG